MNKNIEIDQFGCCVVGDCPYRKECAQHSTAGDFRSESGFKPTMVVAEDGYYCKSKISNTFNNEEHPNVMSGFGFISLEELGKLKDLEKDTDLSGTKGRLEQAKRFALQRFDEWNEVTGFVTPHVGYYYEICGLIEDAAEFGFGVAHGFTHKEIKEKIDNQ